MKHLKSGLVLAAATLGVSMSAFGAAGTLGPDIVVTPLQSNVTYSQTLGDLKTYAGFTVTGFSNMDPNTVNDIVVTLEARVTDDAEKLSINSVFGLPADSCTVPSATDQANPLTITCTIKQLKSGDAFPGFTVFYNVPKKEINGKADGGPSADDADYISTVYTIVYAEGRNDCAANGCSNSVNRYPFPHQVLLGTSNATEVLSGVPGSGGMFFTGIGLATAEDPWLTRVAVPGFDSVPYTQARIFEELVHSSCSPVNLACNQTTLTIPGSFESLQITLQQHPSIIKKGSKIENWKIAYSANPLENAPQELQYCSVDGGPFVNVPCIEECKEYTRKTDPLMPAAWGIFECKVRALTNGLYRTR